MKKNTSLNNTGRSTPSPWKSLPLALVNPTEKHLWNNYQMYQIQKWMKGSVHYFSENNNCITVNPIFVYILKRTSLAPKMTPANCHVICKRESFLCVKTHPFVIIHDGMKDVVVNRKSELYGLRINRIFKNAHGIKRLWP